ncbi:Uncharacterized protein Pyn_07041 [Prunus yedoensis var. nudiflora]|uniref:FAS1 domain-containing protein n=1 Tax=Prunus yedoensis var. nudiflora TaxID=2094558 RepID=A0A314UM55_PRUYE|nr:Uncharacterized protein Pyn_07041 [Prunus yedoensis var. nudiflora]
MPKLMISQTSTSTMSILLLVAFLALTPTIEALCSDTVFTSLSSSGFTVFAHALHSHNLTATANTTVTCFSLLRLPLNTTLPALHHNTRLVFGTDGKRVSFNDVLVTAPNLHIDDSCVVHGVEGPLVPIPSLMDDVPSPTETLPSPALPKHQGRRRFAEVVRFIRRAHNPVLVDGDQDTYLP